MSVIDRHHLTERGSGTRPLVFMHGFGCDQNVWRHVTPAFEDDFRVILFDHVGAGRSDLSQYDPGKYATLDGYASDLIEIAGELDLQDAVVVGHSVSATVAILAAIREPARFARLVLVGPSPCYLNDGDYPGGFERHDIEDLLATMDSNFFGWASSMAPVIMGHPERPALAGELTENFCRTDPAIARHFARVTFLSDTRAVLPQLRVPSLIVQCAADALVPTGVGDYLHAQLAHSTLAVIGTGGHCPHLSDPSETVAAIRDWLAD